MATPLKPVVPLSLKAAADAIFESSLLCTEVAMGERPITVIEDGKPHEVQRAVGIVVFRRESGSPETLPEVLLSISMVGHPPFEKGKVYKLRVE